MSLEIDSTTATGLSNSGKGNYPIAAYENYGRQAGVTLNSSPAATTGNDASNAFAGDTYSYWVPDTTGVTVALLRMTTASSIEPTFWAIDAHNLSDYGARVRLQSSSNSGSTWDDETDWITPSDNKAFGFYFTPSNITDEWRFRIDSFTAGDPISVGVAMLSTVVTFQRPFYQGFTPPIQANDVQLLNNVSVGNNLLGNSIVRKGYDIACEVRNHPESNTRGSTFQGFCTAYNQGTPFFFAWRPTEYGEDLRYCWRSGDTLAPVNSGPRDLFSFQMQMRAYDG